VTNTLVELFEILLLQNLSFTAAFYASVLLLKINFAITLLKFASEPQTMLWRISSSIRGQTLKNEFELISRSARGSLTILWTRIISDVSLLSTGSVCSGSFQGGEVHSTMTVDSEDFVKLFMGRLNPAQAYLRGQIQIKGSQARFLKLEKQLMEKMKSKLWEGEFWDLFKYGWRVCP